MSNHYAANSDWADRSRPAFHYTSRGWINDPCAPGFDAQTGTYHLFYQWNPNSTKWGDICWGHLTSKDMVTWVPANEPALKPDQPYDCRGVFTGCWVPSRGDGILRVIYSSVRALPFHWSTPPYPRDAAGLAMASSKDGGVTWQKFEGNPFLQGEPEGLQVTGFRDPYLAEWPAMDVVRSECEAKLYGIVSGGIEGDGPTAFLYSVKPDESQAWKYVGPLVEPSQEDEASVDERWRPSLGVNWECVNFMTLQSQDETREVLIMGAEGPFNMRQHDQPPGLKPRTARRQLWAFGDLVGGAMDVKFRPRSRGYLDHGTYYAANSYIDPPTGRRIVYGWIPEEDIPEERIRSKGWNGSLALPREVFLLRIPNVRSSLCTPLSRLGSFERVVERDGSTALITIGVKPIDEVIMFRRGCSGAIRTDTEAEWVASGAEQRLHVCTAATSSWELEAVIAIDEACEEVGFHIRHNVDLEMRTTVFFNAASESIGVRRHLSTAANNTNKSPDVGPFTLFRTDTRLEKLHLSIFSDGDVLEVFANSRFALATMVYSEAYGRAMGGITAFSTGRAKSASFERVSLWDRLRSQI